jgi:hypothetical protein
VISLLKLIRAGWTAGGDRSFPSFVVVGAAKITASCEVDLIFCGAFHQGLG